jgi:uncharacterized OB-fold protein
MTSDLTTYRKPYPAPTWIDKPYWDAANESRLVIQRCRQCGRYQVPATLACPNCGGEMEWQQAAGTGTIHTFTIFHKSYHPGFDQELPYNVAIVQLLEGPLMITNIVGCANEDLEIGMPVQIVFERVEEGVAIPKFTPADESAT